MFVYDVVLVQCKKITKFGGVPNIQGVHALFRLGKPSFKKENLFQHLNLETWCLRIFSAKCDEIVRFRWIHFNMAHGFMCIPR